MKVRILRSGYQDLAEARRFYERQRKGLGSYFRTALNHDIDDLAVTGGIHVKVFGFHRHLARRFPYAIYYRVIAGEAVVFRVLDCRQDPHRVVRALRRSL